MKRSIPRVFALLCLVVFARLVSAQEIPNLNSTNKAAIGQPLTLPELVHRVKPSVVSVLTYDLKGEPLISGSGFFVRFKYRMRCRVFIGCIKTNIVKKRIKISFCNDTGILNS